MKAKAKAYKIQNGVYTFKTRGHGTKMIIQPNFKIQALNDKHLFHDAFKQYKLKTGLQPTSLFLDDKQIF